MNEVRILREFERLLDELAEAGRDEVRAQGHVASGRGLRSIEGEITKRSLDDLRGGVFALDYMVGPVDKGVKASRIPYSPGSGRTFSKFVDGLTRWSKIIKPGLREDERKSFVHAVARTMKREGMPTRGSYSFSGNGRRKDWIAYGLVDQEERFADEFRLVQILLSEFEEDIARAANAA